MEKQGGKVHVLVEGKRGKNINKSYGGLGKRRGRNNVFNSCGDRKGNRGEESLQLIFNSVASLILIAV